MNGGVLPIAMLFLAVGFGLARTIGNTAWFGFAALSLTAVVMSFAQLAEAPGGVIFAGLWLSTMASAALVYLSRRISRNWGIAIGINGGAWAGALASAGGMRGQLILALPLALTFLFATWLRGPTYDIALKVVASWLIAIAALAMFVSLTPTPGYAPDHME